LAVTKAQQLVYRREKVLELASTGLSQQEIAAKLLVSQKTVSNDLRYICAMANEEIKKYIEDRLPFEYFRSLKMLDVLKKNAMSIYENTSEGDKTKLMALKLVGELIVSYTRIVSEGPGVLAMNDIQERLTRIEDLQFHTQLRRRDIQIAR
jgi:predicted transcriptional regulator